MLKGALISADGFYRYTLTRVWDAAKPLLLVVMLNPSKADADRDDPTITRLITRAQTEGYGGILVCNLYAWRATDPHELEYRWATQREIIGCENDEIIFASARRAACALVAWGSHKLVKKRDFKVLDILYNECAVVSCIALTKDGFPKHPLHVAYAQRFQPYAGRFAKSLFQRQISAPH